VLSALAAAALLLVPAAAAAGSRTPAAGPPPAEAAPPASDAVVAVAAWAIRSGDTGGLPFAVVDKPAARVYVFGPDGKLKGEAPALVGTTVGDGSTAFEGDRELSSIPLAERTTPAGRFLATWGTAVSGKKTLWVDYPSAVSIHPLASVNEGEHREDRLATPTPADNRITYGCINVPPAFYEQVVQPTFQKAGVFYVLPEASPLRAAIPGFFPPPGFALGDGDPPARVANAKRNRRSR
jgi:hypothetical protein